MMQTRNIKQIAVSCERLSFTHIIVIKLQMDSVTKTISEPPVNLPETYIFIVNVCINIYVMSTITVSYTL